MALNLLIAVLSETFANVYASMNASHCRIKVDVLIEISGLKCCIKKDNSESYLHFLNYSSEKIEGLAEEGDMAAQVDEIATELSDFKTKVQDEIEDIKLKQNETF